MVSRLPIRIRPAPDEIAVSYLARLAALHGLPLNELWSQVSRSITQKCPRLDGDLLAAVANQPRDRLERALIELRDSELDWLALRHEPQRGCPRCDAGHPGGPVLHLFGHHHYVCVRHRTWIGPPDQLDHPLPSLAELPEIVSAQRKHLRLLRQLGPAATFDAVLTGFLICAHRWDLIEKTHGKDIEPEDAWHHWVRRAAVLIPPGTEADTFSPSRLFAAAYPEAVSLAALIGSLRWRRLAAGGPDDQRQFASEIGRRLGQRNYLPRRLKDPIAHWIQDDSWRPPSMPVGNYRTAKTFGGRTFPKPHKRHEQSRRTSAFWFGQNRRAGTVILHHRHTAPVIFRDWAPRTELFEGMLILSQRTTFSLQRQNVSDLSELTNAVFIRPEPAKSEFLDSAVEPVGWTRPAQPPPARTARPWLPGEKPMIHRHRGLSCR
ncbi:TniQ family protein [Pseudonocardia sp. H11422]|uniref:TniQ family protein n=1 Tax=Pseudonocardia sp. H11422 TaxID=2835866 RepID=UPI001BDC6019|nr:TniQ family protein [Pseudonocardia sp. H11422]